MTTKTKIRKHDIIDEALNYFERENLIISDGTYTSCGVTCVSILVGNNSKRVCMDELVEMYKEAIS